MDLVHSSPLPIFNSNTATTSAHSKLVYAVRRNNSPTMSDLSAYMSSPSAAAPATGGAQSAYMSSPGGEAPAAGGEAPAASGGGGAQSAYMSSPTYNQPEPTPAKAPEQSAYIVKCSSSNLVYFCLFCSVLRFLFVAGSAVGSSAMQWRTCNSSRICALSALVVRPTSLPTPISDCRQKPDCFDGLLDIEWADKNSARHQPALLASTGTNSVDEDEVEGTTPFGDIGSGGWTVVEWSPAAADLLQPTNGSVVDWKRKRQQRKVGSNDSGGVMSERLLVWINETVLNELLDQFQWDFKIIEEKIPLNSSKLPYETRDFFANICPQCIFIFNVSADGLPSVTIEDSSILTHRIAAEVENPTIGESGQKKTAIDLTLSLTVQLVPQVRDGIFHTQLNLKERKIDMKNKTAFPKQLKPVVEELLQDMIKDDVWPAVKRGIEPLIYVKGVELPPHCGIDPKSAQLHFGHSKFGASATLNIKEVRYFAQSMIRHQSARTRRLPIAKDTFALFQRRLRLNPFVVGTNEATTELRCYICCDTLMNESPSTAGDVRLLYDGSAIHERCHHRSKCQSEEQQNGVTTVD
uniref:Uncharacterized protein n=1 Tax=Globodera rostochiensis TaxID=31243 RepID=A0A914GWC1_GLORO